MKCRHCNTELKHVFVDLVNCPPSNSMLSEDQLNEPEAYYPLKVYTCHNCWLTQADEIKKAPDIFDNEYTYFSSFSKSWLNHSRQYVDMMVDRFNFDQDSQIIEIASNDGYLLQYFKEKKIPVLGVDPAANTAAVAIDMGINTIIDFYDSQLAEEQLVSKDIRGDLILGNNVLAHVPGCNDLVKGMKIALKDNGVITMEFPHLLRLVEECQFDTIYHEHFSYFSFTTVKRIFESQGLEMFDVEELPTHGGSLRIFAKHDFDTSKEISRNVFDLLEKEEKAGMKTLEYYSDFQKRVDEVRCDVWEFLIDAKKAGEKVIGYGAAAKGNTLLNYCGIKGHDLVQFVVDASPHKQNKYLPGSHILVKDLESIEKYKPGFVIILPWNLQKEIADQLHYIRDWDGQFVTFIPELKIF